MNLSFSSLMAWLGCGKFRRLRRDLEGIDSSAATVSDIDSRSKPTQVSSRADEAFASGFETSQHARPGPKKQMASIHLFQGEQGETIRTQQEAEGFLRRQDTYLLGKFQVVAVPAIADYDAGFNSLQANAVPVDCDGPEGFNGWFWVLHSAAPNIGESAQAEDFTTYSIQEDLYMSDIARLWRNALKAAQYLEALHESSAFLLQKQKGFESEHKSGWDVFLQQKRC
eukprot:Skav216890  [mRNA]  locus=scaffold1276:77458:82105:+ [translate_table: standard]